MRGPLHLDDRSGAASHTQTCSAVDTLAYALECPSLRPISELLSAKDGNCPNLAMSGGQTPPLLCSRDLLDSPSVPRVLARNLSARAASASMLSVQVPARNLFALDASASMLSSVGASPSTRLDLLSATRAACPIARGSVVAADDPTRPATPRRYRWMPLSSVVAAAELPPKQSQPAVAAAAAVPSLRLLRSAVPAAAALLLPRADLEESTPQRRPWIITPLCYHCCSD
eukprot:6487919-Amphidinium_carterae.1